MFKILCDFRRIIIAFFALLISGVQMVLGQGSVIPLSVDSNDTPLIITRQVSDSSISVTGSIRLTYTGENTSTLIALPSDLASESHIIQRSDVFIDTDIVLTNGYPMDIRVTVNNITSPGTYTGQIEFRLSEQNGVLIVPIELHIILTPRVSSLDDLANLEVVRCDSGFECWVSSLFFPDAGQIRHWTLQFENQTAYNVSVLNVTSSFRNSNTYLSAKGISVEYSNPFPAHTVSDVGLIINTSELNPGRYSGRLQLQLEGLENPIIVPVQFAVRRSPLVPLLLIILGILFGRLVRWMDTPLVKGQEDIVKVISTLNNDMGLIMYEPGKLMIAEKITGLRSKNYRVKAETELTEIQKAADDVADRIQKFRSLDKLYIGLSNPPYNKNAIASELKLKIETGYIMLMSERLDSVESVQQIIDEIKAQLDEAVASKQEWLGGQENPSLAPLIKRLDTPRSETILRMPEARPSQGGWFRWAFIKLSGLRTESLPFARALIWLILIIILGLIGFQTQYVNTATTFGAAGIYDYLALILWGLSADVASASILSLPK